MVSPGQTPIRRLSGGFTLLEIIVVTLIMGILATLIIPRFARQDERKADLFIRQVQDLLTMYAFRESMGVEQVGIWQNPINRTLDLVILKKDPELPDEPADWVIDPFTAPIAIPDDMAVTDARTDGQSLGAEDWMIVSVPGSSRPTIEIDINSPMLFTTVVLQPFAVTAGRLDDSGYSNRAVYDLDAAGREREDW
jgi:prepilin-type N-terminal cleavage/methylation domain-containing protein